MTGSKRPHAQPIGLFGAHFRGRVLILTLSVMLAAPAAARAPVVAVTTKPVHALVTQIMAGVAVPVLIVEGAASPHTFTLKPSSARAVNEADIFVRVSPDIEPFTRKLVEVLPASVTVVTLADAQLGIKLLDRRLTGTFDAHAHGESQGDHDGHEDHGSELAHDAHGGSRAPEGTKDGHIWLDPENAKAIVQAVTGALVVKSPEHAGAFKDNAARLVARIDQMSADIALELADAKGKPFIVFHDAYQYFESRFGLSAAGSITVSPDQQPSARRLTDVRRKIASLGAVCVFSEPGFQPKLVLAVTEGTAARTATLDPEGLTLTAGADLYDTLMRELAHNIKACLLPAP
ncbi:MAG: zinc ABC transporter substrate-binding protein [Hyphomicrobium sp.]